MMGYLVASENGYYADPNKVEDVAKYAKGF
jgi:hypothetical protein